MEKEKITLDDITNPKLKENIEKLQGKINQFFGLVRNEVYELNTNFDCRTQNAYLIASKEDYHAYADDGNTKVPGCSYDFYFILPFTMSEKEELETKATPYCLSHGYCHNILYFHYKVNERTSDGKLWSPFVTLYYNRNPKACFDTDATSKGYKTCGDELLRIDHNNDNYELTSVCNIKNAAECIELISRDATRIALMRKLEKYNNTPLRIDCEPINL